MEAYNQSAVRAKLDQRRMLDIMQHARGIGEAGRVETGQLVEVLISYLKGADGYLEGDSTGLQKEVDAE
ncbi:hypothetical protein [Bacillus marinisedimentorum]|uniref:hypothetical protein n=1 Tax=Bacillus marinisedimentorum TaxID=1821260 RepID=UPI0007E1BCF0|nr:hypothetical protein [Bacillus marinisedimentorum]